MSNPKYVIVAEDDSFLREIMQTTLEERGLEVLACQNGEEAVQKVDERQPDLLMLDLLMPQRDGYGVLTYCKERGYQFPVIILSNVSDDMNQARCTELGAVDFIVKSDIDEDQLWSRIERFLPAE